MAKDTVMFTNCMDGIKYEWPHDFNKSMVLKDCPIINFWDGRDGSIPNWIQILFSSPKMTVGLFKLAPGQYAPNSQHRDDELYYVLEGVLTDTINDKETHDVYPGESFIIKAGDWHRAINCTDKMVVALFVISGDMDEMDMN